MYLQFTDADWVSFWNNPYSETDNEPARRIVGYAETFYGIADYANSGSWEFTTNINQKLNGEPVSMNGTTFSILPSSRIQLACATITSVGDLTQNYAVMQTYPWIGIPHSDDPDVPGTKTFTSAHLLNARLPSGANVGMIDGHVEWRRLQDLIPRAGGGGSGPAFYY
jgi:prepilin-type processing-associated H-X9-DG protein